MKLSLQPKLVENLVWVSVISFCKIFIPSSGFDAPYYAETGHLPLLPVAFCKLLPMWLYLYPNLANSSCG
jgi:hypothetical protein